MSRSSRARRLSTLAAGERGHVVGVMREAADRAARLGALGVTPGALVRVLQTFPSVVFLCDETELAVEPAVAQSILIDVSSH